MASTNCWRCLARPSQRVLSSVQAIPSISTSQSTTAAAACFSTSARRLAAPQSKPSASKDSGTPNLSRHIRSGKKMVLGRKKPQLDKGKSAGPGERKAFRKRIQLSNDNALEVEGSPLMDLAQLSDPEAVGRVASLPPDLIDRLRAIEAFKPTQNWGLFRSPHLLIRRETVELIRRIQDAVARKETARVVLTGERGSGKSILSLQALSAGFMNNWIVINIPEAQDLTNANTEYSPLANSEMFAQPIYMVKLMQTIFDTNRELLSKHRVEMDHIYLPVSVTRGTTLAAMLSATREPEFAWPVFQAFWQELLRPGRPPILLALDGLHHLMRVSEYRSPAFELIHSHDLALCRLLADSLGGRTKFSNGAVVLGVTSRNNTPTLPSVEVALEQAAARQAGVDPADAAAFPQRDPWYRGYDERVFAALDGVEVLPVRGVSRPEARALLEYWAASGILRQRVDEYSVCEKWTLAGGGVLAEMERVVLFDNRVSM
ncbi:hypothetical protein SLS62_008890 [Diatrype stigma]|uniref:Small ribosomal subunit protein mS29 n=1 Tax=Diatrype stigma TaxID=117547 RepID=A0AAN9UH31_9PEZI